MLLLAVVRVSARSAGRVFVSDRSYFYRYHRLHALMHLTGGMPPILVLPTLLNIELCEHKL